jgi:prepilin-type N-terminal cleavage/methylation domain-containing protein
VSVLFGKGTKIERKGFTLVELLVVIAVLALLMGILMPALARARQLAYRVVCGTNLYGLGRAMLAYAQDDDNVFTISDRATTGSAMGTPPPVSQFNPANRNDSVLVHDPGQSPREVRRIRL